MTPWQIAEKWHNTYDATISFAELVGQYLSGGLVYSTDKVFLLAAETHWNAEEQHFEQGPSNCWHVTLAASTGHANACGEFMRVFPHPQPWVSWFRGSKDDRVRIYDWDKLTKATRRK
jgi:hypothetical protein